MIAEIIVGIFLFIASIIDIKTREVPNFLSYGMIAFVSLNAIYVNIDSLNNLVYPILGLAISWLLGYILYRTGQWGGGDVKLLMAMGIYFGITLTALPIFLVFVLAMFVSGGVLGVVYSFFMAIFSFKKFKEAANELLSDDKVHSVRRIITTAVIFMLILSIVFRMIEVYMLLGATFFIWMGFFVWILVKSVETATMIKDKKTSNLVEGDWLLNPVKKGKQIVKPREIGLTLEDIIALKKMKIKSVIVKDGLPFVPSFFVGYILTLTSHLWFPF